VKPREIKSTPKSNQTSQPDCFLGNTNNSRGEEEQYSQDLFIQAGVHQVEDVNGLDQDASCLNEEQVDNTERKHKRGNSFHRFAAPGLAGKYVIILSDYFSGILNFLEIPVIVTPTCTVYCVKVGVMLKGILVIVKMTVGDGVSVRDMRVDVVSGSEEVDAGGGIKTADDSSEQIS